MTRINRRRWICPWCARSWEIPADAGDPDACPICVPPKSCLPAARPDAIVTPASRAREPRKTPARPWGNAFIMLIFFLGFSVWATWRGTPPPIPIVHAPTPVAQTDIRQSDVAGPTAPPVARGIRLGDPVMIDMGPGVDLIFLPADDATWNEYQKAVAAMDEMGVARLALAGRGTTVRNGTRAKLIERGWMTFRVRITEGETTGRAGWIDKEFVKECPARRIH